MIGRGTRKERPEGRSQASRGPGRRRPGPDSVPAQTGRWAGSLCVVVRHRCGGPGHEAHHYHLSPAPSERAIVARSDRATVKRARFAFTAPPQKGCIPALASGNRAVFRGKIPGFASPARVGFALDGCPSRSGHRSTRTVPGGVPSRQATVVPVDGPLGSVPGAPRRRALVAASGRRDHQTTTPSGRSVVRAAWPRARRLIGGTTWALAACTSTASRSAAAAGRPNR